MQDRTRGESFVSPIEPWELVNSVEVDKRGRLLVTGAWIDGSCPIPGTSPSEFAACSRTVQRIRDFSGSWVA